MQRMESEGFQLEAITPPGFPGPQRICMEFCRAVPPKRSGVTLRGFDLSEDQLIQIVDDRPLGARYYFFRRCAEDTS